jgi:mRNA interferase HigB
MRIIAKKHYMVFCFELNIDTTPFDRWHDTIKRTDFNTPAELKKLFPSADFVSGATVFNIGGNKYRLITKIDYQSKKVYIRSVLTHKEYDKGKWKEDPWFSMNTN